MNMNLYLGTPEVSNLISYTIDKVMPELTRATLRVDSNIRFENKPDKTLVSAFDKKLEMMLVGVVEEYFPGLDIVSEESPHVWPPTSSGFCIIDPLDGTHNFLMGAPIFGSMLAFVRDGRVDFSMIVTSREICFAERGMGAFMIKDPCGGPDGTRHMKVSSQTDLKEALVLFDGPSERIGPLIGRISGEMRRFRHGLSAAVSQILLASGGLYPSGADAVVSIGNKPWDHLAGCLLVEEAGGKVTDLRGNPYSITNCNNIVFSNGKIHEQIVETLCG